MTTFITTCVLALSLQFPVDPPITLTLRDREIILKKSEAEAWYKVVDPVKDQALHVALTHALGTVPEYRVFEPELTPQERERFRWHRRPLQATGQR